MTDGGEGSTTYTVNTTPTVGLGFVGPDFEGMGQIVAPYTFRNAGVGYRNLELYLDGDYQFGMWHGTEVAGTWIRDLNTACKSQGSHTLEVRAIACGGSHESFLASDTTTFVVDHQPSVDASVSPADPNFPGGQQKITVNYSFPQTGARSLRIEWADSGSTIYSDASVNDQTGTVERTVSCSPNRRMARVMVVACGDTSAEQFVEIPGCESPLFETCTESDGGTSGASRSSCPMCDAVPGDAGCSVSKTGKASCTPDWAGKAQLRYAADGVGGDRLPGDANWRTVLGRFWSHDYAERIVRDADSPAPGPPNHVWLLTKHGSFKEFEGLDGSGWYTVRAPSDEYRSLHYDSSTGWQVHSLDGRVDHYRLDGQWAKTVLASDPDHPTQGTYINDRLTAVSFPDGTGDQFEYYPNGKLWKIIQLAVPGSGTPNREWVLVWNSDELTEIHRPDGTYWRYYYDPARPGHLTRVDLMRDTSFRIMAAFDYFSGTNLVARSWRGDPSFDGSNAVDKVAYSYDNPEQPEQVVVNRVVSSEFTQTTTYNLGRDTVSDKAKVLSFTGTCPTCGLSPNTSFTYDPAHPLLPETMTDGRGTVTHYEYDSNGRLVERIEAANVSSLIRTTTYEYDSSFPGLVKLVALPSTSGQGQRTTGFNYDSVTGFMTSRAIDGFEGGDALPADFKTTAFTPNASGEVVTVNPPGFGTADATTFTYNLPNRNGHVPDSRTDPNPPHAPMVTSFGYDGFNRRTSVTDPNGVPTTTVYDLLDRVVEVRQHGAVPVDDLVTTYTYNGFGDLFCTRLPRGNGVQYVYDFARRLVEVHRGTVLNAATCLDTSLPREKVVYTLDTAGNRIAESHERSTGPTTWAAPDSRTAYTYKCHLEKVVQGAGSSMPSTTEYCYDANDNLTHLWDANHDKQSNPDPTQLHGYDALNRLATVRVGPGTGAATTAYVYDVQDHLRQVTDAEGNVTTYTTSDRDLLTREVSTASGISDNVYNAHGVLVSTLDARGILKSRTVDAAGRVTLEAFGPPGSPDPALTNEFQYGTYAPDFNVGRLTRAIRYNGHWAIYEYDRFGRVIRDGIGGAFRYEYDKNGYRTRIENAGQLVRVAAIYTPDYADRDASLAYEHDWVTYPLVTSATYLASGPLASLELANGVSEERSFDGRYYPEAVRALPHLELGYTVDGVGNPLAIAGTLEGVSLTSSFSYRDNLYYLEGAEGPWGTREWTYDRIGNRLTSDDGETDTIFYTYSGSGHGPRLLEVLQATRTWGFSYDDSGNQTSLVDSNEMDNVFREIGADGKPLIFNDDKSWETHLLYDARGFLASAGQVASDDFYLAEPRYTSDGVLRELFESHTYSAGLGTITKAERTNIFYFAGRPVGLLSDTTGLRYLTTDHLGVPALVTDPAGESVWAGIAEPFRAEGKTFLRNPGQWHSGGLGPSGGMGEVAYNVHRWYEPNTGRYTQSDPLSRWGDPHPYAYARSSPLTRVDPLGLVSWTCLTLPELSVGAGLTAVWFPIIECWSECINDRRARGFYTAGGFGIGGGVGIEVSDYSVDDGSSVADPTNLEGHFGMGTCSLTPGIGIDVETVTMGRGRGEWSSGLTFGAGIGCFTITGGVKLMRKTEECCQSNPPDHPVISPR